MKLDIQICRTVAVRYGLPLQFVFKEFNLMDVMGQIASSASVHPKALVFKGGTALNKVYLQKTQRFSEDADYDLVIGDAGSELMGFCKRLASGIEGYSISEFRRIRGTVQFYCKYETPLGAADHVRIDIAAKTLKTAKPLESRTAISEFTHSSVSGLTVYSIEDLTARKMNALASRDEGKDVYDVYNALPLCSPKIMTGAIGQMLKSEGESLTVSQFLQKARRRVEGLNPQRLRNITNPFIPSALRPSNWEELRESLLLKLEEMEASL